MKHRVTHKVRHKAQQKTFTCGPTCLEMLFDFYDIAHDPEKLEDLCRSSAEYGTHNHHLVEAAESLGAEVIVKEDAVIDDIIDVLNSGHPILVNYFNPVSKVGHFGIVKGLEDDVLLFADPKNGDDYQLSVEDFSGLWHNHDKTIRGWMMHLV